MSNSKGEALEKKKNQDIKYLKADFLNSRMFSPIQKDILKELLEDNKKYTIKQCEDILNKENERKVK